MEASNGSVVVLAEASLGSAFSDAGIVHREASDVADCSSETAVICDCHEA